MFNVEDDDDFVPAASSKLASLFGQSSDPGNTSLTYTAPKQPKKGQPGINPAVSSHAGQATKLNLLIVKVVQTFRLEAETYNPQGKLGAAVLGCPTSRVYQLLLYKNKQQQITTTKIIENFKFTVQSNKYASFYDDQRQNWSILFDSDQDVLEFARQIGVACASSYRDQDPQPFYVQDLKLGNGTGAEFGDHLEVRYTTSSFINCSIAQELESNLKAEKPQRIKIRKGAWEEALLGIGKGGKRLIILSPILFGPWKPQAPPNSRLAVEIEVVRIKSARKSREPTPTRLKHLAESSESNVDSSTDETSIKARGASISEALTNSPKTHKASIISRMARMGQATLPLKGAVVCNPSDSEETEEEGVNLSGGSSSTTSKPTVKTRNSVSKPRSSRQTVAQEPPAVPVISAPMPTATPTSTAQQLTVFSSPWQHMQPPSPHMVNGMPYTLPPHMTQVDGSLYSTVPQHQLFPSAASVGTPPDSYISVLMSESRAQNAELRMGMNKIVDKVDQVIVKVDGHQQQRSIGQGSMGIMEPSVLLANIQKLVNEHGLMQAELADKRSKLEQQTEKMYELLHANQKFMEQNNSMKEQKQDTTLQTTIVTLQQEKEKVAADLRVAESKTLSLQEETDKYRRTESELREEMKSVIAELHKHQEELKSSQLLVIELEKKLLKSREELKMAKEIQESQESTIADLKANKAELQSAAILTEESLSKVHQQLKEKDKQASEQLAIHKEALKNLEVQLKNLLISGNRNADVDQFGKQAEEMSEKHRIVIADLKKDKAKLQENINQLKEQLKACSISNLESTADVVENVKKIMNFLFRLLNSKFTPGAVYEGARIREILLVNIKDVTLNYLSSKMASGIQPSRENVNQASGKVPKPERNEDPSPAKILTFAQLPVEDGRKPVGSTSSQMDVVNKENLQTSLESSVEQKLRYDEETKNKPSDGSNIPTTHVSTSDVEINETPDVKPSEPQTNLLTTPVPEPGIKQPRDSSLERSWRPQPPPSPLFDEEDDDDDWLS